MSEWDTPAEATQAPPPYIDPDAEEAPLQGSTPAGEEQTVSDGAETQATGAPDSTSETESAASDARTEPEEELSGDVKRQARKLWAQVNEMGGEPVFEVAQRLATSYLDPRPEGPRKFVGELKALEKQYWPVRDEIVFETIRQQPDDVLRALAEAHPDRRAQIERVLQGGQPEQPEWYDQSDPSDPQSPSYDPLKDPNLSDAVKARIREADALQQRIAPLEEKVKAFDQLTERQQAEEVTRIGNEFLGEVFSPVEQMIKEAGLEVLPDDPEEVRADKQYAANAIRHGVLYDLQSLPENKPLYDEVEILIQRGDKQGAMLRLERARARAERAAERHVRYHSGRQVKARDSRTKPLNRETPRVIPEAAQTGIPATTSRGPAFDIDEAAAVAADIKARVS